MDVQGEYQVLKGYIGDDGKFTRFPGKREKEKQTLMLRWLSEKFETNRKYSEMEVNAVLNEYHSFNDPATLRRLMFGHRFLNRTLDGRSYWVVD